MAKQQRSTLARTLADLAVVVEQVDDTAGALLDTIRGAHISTVEAWRAVVKEAYAENGWNVTAGQPKRGSAALPVPPTVRVYVAEVTAAFKLGLRPGGYKSFYAMRTALKQAKAGDGQARSMKRGPIELRDVTVARKSELTGHIVHDVAVVYMQLRPQLKQRMLRELESLLAKYEPQAVALQGDEAEAPKRKAA